jgi:structural maintenance of chromosome 4
VEQIAMMRPKAKEGNGQEDGLLEYLEEIIGSNRHVPAITAAAQEVHAHSPAPHY